MAAVGDGSWDPQTTRVARSALLNDGRVLGGSIDTSDVVGGARNNYDGESAHRLDVLAAVPGERLFYIFDSTSPIAASERFRRLTTSARSRCECDDWLGTGLVLENDMQMVAYWWSKSHIGHLPEAAVDALAKEGTKVGAHEPVPHRRSRHVSLRFYAKKSERDFMLTALNMYWI